MLFTCTFEEYEQIRAQLEALRAMLAALILVREDPNARKLGSTTLHDLKAAIGAAEAAGIKVES